MTERVWAVVKHSRASGDDSVILGAFLDEEEAYGYCDQIALADIVRSPVADSRYAVVEVPIIRRRET